MCEAGKRFYHTGDNFAGRNNHISILFVQLQSSGDNITACTGRIEDYKPVVDLAHLHIQLIERYSENSGASSLAGPL